ncbi:anthranilate synthase component I family protein [soil metagenome]
MIAELINNNKTDVFPETIKVRVEAKRLLDDTCTPVSLYLRLRDKFPGAVLLESADNAEGKNARSFIAINPVAEIKTEFGLLKISVPSLNLEKAIKLENGKLANQLNDFLSLFQIEGNVPEDAVTGLIGYTSYDAIPYFEDIDFKSRSEKAEIPVLRYALYKNVIVFDHLRHQLQLVSQLFGDENSDTELLEALIRNTDVPQFRFDTIEKETANMNDADFLAMVEKGKQNCKRGDVFQIVLSRRFKQKFKGDEFNVYRALRAINPSPYLFFADFGDYRIFGSSPEAQLVVNKNFAYVHPIAGTFRRTGNDAQDNLRTEELLKDPKENAEHIMLVDLARNDLSKSTSEVTVESFREVHCYSHVIHLVSKVCGKIKSGINSFQLMSDTFPAGTLSGAPKVRAMQLIDEYEPTSRSFYGGCIGLIGFDGNMNQAIMIRSFLSKNGELTYQAGAGIVVNSVPESELQEINNKLGALRNAIQMAKEIKN